MSQKDFMGAEDLEYVNLPQYASSSIPTDVIISSYENKISQNIAAKTLLASKRGEPADFTKEELLYLNKKSGENEDAELKVITPTPAITLKKGKTELNIGHAVTLVKKMEEKYPTTNLKQDATQIDKFKHNVNFSVKDVSEEVWQGYKNIVETTPSVDESLKLPGGFEQPPIKTVNKNAYEIRSDVLKMSLEFFKWQTEMKIQIDSENGIKLDGTTLKPTSDNVLEIAQKFYKFVENKR